MCQPVPQARIRRRLVAVIAIFASAALAGCPSDARDSVTGCGPHQGGASARGLGLVGPAGLAIGPDGQVVYATTAFDGAEAVITKRGPDGDMVWETPVDASVRSVALTEQGHVLVTGSQPADSGRIGRAWITKLDEQGESIWSQTLGAEGAYWTGTHVGGDSSGIWLLGEETRIGTDVPNPTTTVRPFVARLGADGEVQWQQPIGEASIYTLGLAVDLDGAVVGIRLNTANLEIAGAHYESANIATLLVRFGLDGTAEWSQEVGESSDDEMENLTRGADGTLFVTGTRARHDLAFTANKTFVAAVTRDGDVLWRRDYAEGHQMTDSRLAESPCGGLVLSVNWSAPDGSTGIVIIELNREGEEQSRQRFVGDDYVFATHIAALGDGIVMLGQFRGKIDFGTGDIEADSNAAFLARLVK